MINRPTNSIHKDQTKPFPRQPRCPRGTPAATTPGEEGKVDGEFSTEGTAPGTRGEFFEGDALREREETVEDFLVGVVELDVECGYACEVEVEVEFGGGGSGVDRERTRPDRIGSNPGYEMKHQYKKSNVSSSSSASQTQQSDARRRTGPIPRTPDDIHRLTLYPRVRIRGRIDRPVVYR